MGKEIPINSMIYYKELTRVDNSWCGENVCCKCEKQLP
jgi:hypothetical protein